MKTHSVLFISSYFFILAGCGAHNRSLDGPTATLEITTYRNSFDNFGVFMVDKIDGKAAGFSPYTISPGNRHLTVRAQFVNGMLGGGEQLATTQIQVKFEPNKAYRLNGKVSGSGNLLAANYTVEMWIEDKNTGKVVTERAVVKAGAVPQYIDVPMYFGR